MSENQLDRQVEHAFSCITPDIFDSVLADCGESAGNITYLDFGARRTVSAKARSRALRRIGSLAAALLLVLGVSGGAWAYKASVTPVAVVSLDVNPGMDIEVNRAEKVICVIPKNQDAQTVLEDKNYRGTSLDEAVAGIAAAMQATGYISDAANSLLVSVQSSETERAAGIQEKLNGLLQERMPDCSVLSQTVQIDDALQQLAEDNGITVGKALLVKKIVDASGQYTFADLAKLSINDLNLLISSARLVLEEVSSVGSVSEGKYIGHEAAVQTALEHAQLTEEMVQKLGTIVAYENGTMLYDVAFEHEGSDYQYKIDALTGVLVESIEDTTRQLQQLPQTPEEWEAWGEEHGDAWEAWAEEYGDAWETWGEEYGESWEAWGEAYGESWEAWAEAWGHWAKQNFRS